MRSRAWRLAGLVLTLSLVMAACGGDDDAATTTVDDTTVADTTVDDTRDDGEDPQPEDPDTGSTEAIIDGLPEHLAVLYEGYPGEVTTSVYGDFPASDGPWRVCHSESFQGNPWRVAVTEELERLAAQFEAAGLVESFQMADSNGDVSLQITQMQTFIDQGCDVILTIPGSATGLDEVIEAANAAGIPVVSFAGAVTSPYALNVDSNYYHWGYEMADAIGRLDPEAKVLVVEGIAGHPIVAQQAEGREAALANHPDIEVVATVNGDWTPTTTKNAVLQVLATNPSDITAVWTSGSESRLVTEAFVESGREVPLVTGSISGDALGYWAEDPDGFWFSGNAVLPHFTAQTAFRAALRLLEGQGPLLNTVLIPLPPVAPDDLDGWHEECMTPDSGSIFPIPPDDPVSEDEMSAFFAAGAATPPYDYATTPPACG